MSWLLRFLFLPAALLGAGCASLKTTDFAGQQPVLAPDRFFTGHARSTGVLENRDGAPMQHVTTATSGHWENHVLHLEQDLAFSGGKKQHRSWQLRREDAHHFSATANDIIGTAHGEAYGNVFHWSFILALTPGNPFTNIRMSQWMYLQPDGRTMLNHTTISKLGLVLAQVTEAFHRDGD